MPYNDPWVSSSLNMRFLQARAPLEIIQPSHLATTKRFGDVFFFREIYYILWGCFFFCLPLHEFYGDLDLCCMYHLILGDVFWRFVGQLSCKIRLWNLQVQVQETVVTVVGCCRTGSFSMNFTYQLMNLIPENCH